MKNKNFSPSRKLNHIALFAGMGGFIVAANRLDIKTTFINEVDRACNKTLAKNFPNVGLCQKDIREVGVQDLAENNDDVDILSAGFPCQSFSQAGANKGFADERGKLFFEITRLASLLVAPPKVLILENVPFLSVFNGGERLAVVLNHLRTQGYWIGKANCHILNSKGIVGTPQNRERLYIIACHSKYFKKNPFGEINFVKSDEKKLWDLIDRSKKQVDPKLYLAEDSKYHWMINESIEKFGDNLLHQLRRTEVRVCPPGTCPTLTANMGGGGHNVPFLKDVHGIRRLSNSECMLLQGYAEGEIEFPANVGKGRRLSMIGNSIHVDVVEQVFQNVASVLMEMVNENRMEFSTQ